MPTTIITRTPEQYSMLAIEVHGVDSIAPEGPAKFEDVYLGENEWDIILGSRLFGERIITISVSYDMETGRWVARWIVQQDAAGGWAPYASRTYQMPLDGPDAYEITAA